MLPIGGYVAMAGEMDEDDDPNSFDKKPAWQRFIITVAGACVNIIAGFLAMLILTSVMNVYSTTVTGFADMDKTGYEISSSQSGLRVGDTILAVDGKTVKIYDELSYEIMRRGHEPVDLTVLREGKTLTLYDVVFPTLTESSQTFGTVDFGVSPIEKTFSKTLSLGVRKSVLMIRTTWESLYDLITGRYTFAALSGPVGISSAIGEAARAGFEPLLYITALISINLGVMNLLPIPALDGGRTVTLLFEMITRRRIPVKAEGIINTVGLILLLGLTFVVMGKDIFQLIN
jgi:regulator of sigma E protease